MITVSQLNQQRSHTNPTRLRQLREEHGIPLRLLGQIVGATAAGLNYIEHGKCEPKVGLAIRLAQFFEVSVEELFGCCQEEAQDG